MSKPSKKTVEKAKQKKIEDLTFGLKNKSKSKAVQKFIKSVHQQAEGNRKKTEKEKEAERRKQEKLMEKEQEKLMRELFKPVEDRKKTPQEEQQEKDAQALKDQLSKQEAEPDYSNMSLEEVIEIKRARIVNGTPVTLESFTKWKEDKRLREEQQSATKRKNAITEFKKSGRGISGKDLFAYDATLFQDDADATEAAELIVDEDADIDEDLFADEEGEENTEGEGSGARVYNPDTWQGKTPKELLIEVLQANKIKDMPQFVLVNNKPNEVRVKCVLPPALDKEEFEPVFAFKNKKEAEHNAALMAMDFLEHEKGWPMNIST